MKKTFLIAGFLVLIMLIAPCSSAIKMSLAEADRNLLFDLTDKIEDEKLQEEVKAILNQIINDDNELDVEKIFEIVEEYVSSGRTDVLNNGAWDWIKDRLGYIYIIIDYVVNIINQAKAVYQEFSDTIPGLLDEWLAEIGEIKTALTAFLSSPSLDTMEDFLLSLRNAIDATIDIIDGLQDGPLKIALQNLLDLMEEFYDYLAGDNPGWTRPVHIIGNMINIDEPATISCTGDSVTTSGSFELEFDVSGAISPFLPHMVAISAEYKGKTKTKTRFAFSDGTIEVDFEASEFKVKDLSRDISTHFKLQSFLARLHMFLLNLFEKQDLRLMHLF